MDMQHIPLSAPSSMKLALVTAAYTGLRNDRPASYYLDPLNHFIEQVSGSQDLVVHVFTNDNIPSGPNIIVHHDPLGEMVQEVWPVDDWIGAVKKVGPRFPVQQEYPRTIGVYLSKIVMARRIGKQTQLPVLWMDAGHTVSQRFYYLANRQAKHDFRRNYSAYRSIRVDPEALVSGCMQLLEKNPITLTTSGSQAHVMHEGCKDLLIFGIPMKRYMVEFDAHLRGNLNISATLFLLRNEAIEFLFSEFCKNWRRLVDDGFMGTEENALDLLFWSHPDVAALPYNEWFHLLGFKKPLRIPYLRKNVRILPSTRPRP